MSLRVRFVRHGQSQSNIGETFDSAASILLTPTGHEQAAALAESFVQPPSSILCSPYLRAVQTATPLWQRFLCAFEIKAVQEFTYLSREKYCRTTKFQRKGWLLPYWEALDVDYVDGPGAESFLNCVDRANGFLRQLEALVLDGPLPEGEVVVVSHQEFLLLVEMVMGLRNAVCREIDHRAMEFRVDSALMAEFSKVTRERSIPNCGGYTAEFDGTEWSVNA